MKYVELLSVSQQKTCFNHLYSHNIAGQSEYFLIFMLVPGNTQINLLSNW